MFTRKNQYKHITKLIVIFNIFIKKLTRVITMKVSKLAFWEFCMDKPHSNVILNRMKKSQYFLLSFENNLFLIIGNLYIPLYSNSKTFLLMNNLYVFGGGVYGFQGVMDPVLEIELRKCKTQNEKDEVIEAYRTVNLIIIVGSIVLGVLVCGAISLFT